MLRQKTKNKTAEWNLWWLTKFNNLVKVLNFNKVERTNQKIMKKIFTLIALFSLQMICFSQIITKKVKDIDIKKITKSDAVADKMVSYEITLNSIAIAEASRNTIDNNDCRQTWGEVKVEFREVDSSGQLDWSLKPIKADFDQTYLFYSNPLNGVAHRSNSYYQDRMGVNEDNFIKKVNVRVPEQKVKNRRIVAVVTSEIQTAHKDNDFATYDRLRVKMGRNSFFYLEDIPVKNESTMITTDGRYIIDERTGSMIINGGNSDDSHRVWLYFTIKKKS